MDPLPQHAPGLEIEPSALSCARGRSNQLSHPARSASPAKVLRQSRRDTDCPPQKILCFLGTWLGCLSQAPLQ